MHTPWADTPQQADTSTARYPLGSNPSPWADTPWPHSPRADTPSQADGHCSGRYASYWNAFLFLLLSMFLKSFMKNKNMRKRRARSLCNLKYFRIKLISLILVQIARTLISFITQLFLQLKRVSCDFYYF